ncbi:MAG: hypothetical protein CSA52_01405 [Gammaproteobacteria bacterium]|nr:MAG: hypothetical protein CSB48_09915 [Pseudomonadota bacterium]PIE38734.1 MAG: hypothetical protein CSA52_01405 [Gammaproteobacteria bacterium]
MIETRVNTSTMKSVAVRNIAFSIIGYFLGIVCFGAVIVPLGLAESPLSHFVYLFVYAASFSYLAMAYVRSRACFDYRDSKVIGVILGANWCIAFVLWLPMLGDARPSALILSLSIISYYYRFSSVFLSIFCSGIIVLLYVLGSIVSHVYLKQGGDITHDLYMIAAYVPISILLTAIGAKYARQKYALSKLVKKQENIYQKLSQAHVELELLATTDELTKLANRREMNTRLAYEFDRVKRNNATLSILIIDVDHFKSVNDRYGHSFGDKVLKEFANVLKRSLRATDYVARWGGEEFLVVMPDTNGKEARHKAEELARKVKSRKFSQQGQNVTMTFSGGVAELSPELSIEGLIHLADNRLYEAKKAGRDRIIGE